MVAWIQHRGLSYHGGLQDPLRVTVTTIQQLEAMVRQTQAAKMVSADTETSGLRWDTSSQMVGYVSSMRREDGAVQSYYLPFRHLTGEAQIDQDTALRAIGDMLFRSRSDQTRWWWNRKFDEHILRREQAITSKGPGGVLRFGAADPDGMLAARLYDENRSAKLKVRALEDLGDPAAHVFEKMLDRETLRLAKLHSLKKKEYRSQFGYSQIPIHMAGTYGCYDGEFTLRLAEKYLADGVIDYYSKSPRGPEFPSLWETETELTGALTDMEEWGVPLDRGYIHKLRESTYAASERLEQQIWDALGHHQRFDLDSDADLRVFLQRNLGLELTRKTKKGDELSVDREVLLDLAEQAPVCATILDRREARKIATTYADNLLARTDANGLLHCNFMQNGADTGRMSATDPNLHNQAADSDARAIAATGLKLEDGGQDPWSVRRGFTVRPGWGRLCVDYSQVELRVLAHYSQDPQLLDVYRTGGDIHDRTTQLIFGTIEKAKRKTAKMANFGTSFGLTPIGLARRARIPEAEAEAFMDKFNQAYPGIPGLREQMVRQTRRAGGWFNNMFGRTNRVPGIMSSDARLFRPSTRKIIARLIQGTAADLNKAAVVRVHRWLREENLQSRICLNIHDELQADTPHEEAAYVFAGMKRIMEDMPDFTVPIIADGEYTTTNWADKKAIPA